MLKNKFHPLRYLTSDCCRPGIEGTFSPMLQCCLVSGCKVEAQVAEPAANVANFAFRGKGLGTPAQNTEVQFRGGLAGFMVPLARLPTACRKAGIQRCRLHGSQCPLWPVCARGRCACTSWAIPTDPAYWVRIFGYLKRGKYVLSQFGSPVENGAFLVDGCVAGG